MSEFVLGGLVMLNLALPNVLTVIFVRKALQKYDKWFRLGEKLHSYIPRACNPFNLYGPRWHVATGIAELSIMPSLCINLLLLTCKTLDEKTMAVAAVMLVVGNVGALFVALALFKKPIEINNVNEQDIDVEAP